MSYQKQNSFKIVNIEIGNKVMGKTWSIKSLEFLLDEHLSWKYHIKTIENKLSRNICLLCCTKQFLDEISLKTIYFLYVHSFF